MKTWRAAFSLIELLVVMAIASLLIAMGLTALRGLAGVNLSTTVVQVQGILTQARQSALALNQYAQVRFYKLPGANPDGYVAVGCFVADSPYYPATAADAADTDAYYAKLMERGAIRAETRIEFLPPGYIIPLGAVGLNGASQLLTDLAQDTDFKRKGQSTIRGVTYDWVAFYFRPNGAADFQPTTGNPAFTKDKCYFTICPKADYSRTQPKLPSNFATFSISAANGICNVLRP